MTTHPHTSSLADTNPTALGWRVGVLVFLAAAGLYLATAQRGASWQDSGEYQWRSMTGDYLLTGGARSHPLYIAIGQCVYRLTGAEHYCTVLDSLNGVEMPLHWRHSEQSSAGLVWPERVRWPSCRWSCSPTPSGG